MASEVKTNKVSPSTGTTLSVGDSGDTLALAVDSVTGLKVGSDAAGDVLYNDGTDYTRLAKPGTPAGEVLTFATSATAPSWVAASSAGFTSVQVFPSTLGWTRPTDITKVIVQVQGAGGGGGGGNDSAKGSGGGAGGWISAVVDVSGISSSTITIGAGGALGGTSANGSVGGSSSWADATNTLTATGGGAGGLGNADGGLSGTGTSSAGSDITGFFIRRGSMGGSNSTSGATGDGGSSVWGAGAMHSYTGSALAAYGYGGGGGGGWNDASAGHSGTAGAGGYVIVWEYK